MRIVETNNFCGDCPNEKFVNIPSMPKEACRIVAEIINFYAGPDSNRWWKAVDNNYKLQPGFEP